MLPVSGLDGATSLILPVIALALPVAGAIARLAQAGLAVALAQDHVLAARVRAVSRRLCHRIAVMDAGRIVEEGPSLQVIAAPQSTAARVLIAASD